MADATGAEAVVVEDLLGTLVDGADADAPPQAPAGLTADDGDDDVPVAAPSTPPGGKARRPSLMDSLSGIGRYLVATVAPHPQDSPHAAEVTRVSAEIGVHVENVLQTITHAVAPPPEGVEVEDENLLAPFRGVPPTLMDGPGVWASIPLPATGQLSFPAALRGNCIDCGIWERSPCEFSVENRPTTKTFHILFGMATITDKDGRAQTLTAGSWYTLPKGWHGQWKITERLRKMYVLTQ